MICKGSKPINSGTGPENFAWIMKKRNDSNGFQPNYLRLSNRSLNHYIAPSALFTYT